MSKYHKITNISIFHCLSIRHVRSRKEHSKHRHRYLDNGVTAIIEIFDLLAHLWCKRT